MNMPGTVQIISDINTVYLAQAHDLAVEGLDMYGRAMLASYHRVERITQQRRVARIFPPTRVTDYAPEASYVLLWRLETDPYVYFVRNDAPASDDSDIRQYRGALMHKAGDLHISVPPEEWEKIFSALEPELMVIYRTVRSAGPQRKRRWSWH